MQLLLFAKSMQKNYPVRLEFPSTPRTSPRDPAAVPHQREPGKRDPSLNKAKICEIMRLLGTKGDSSGP